MSEHKHSYTKVAEVVDGVVDHMCRTRSTEYALGYIVQSYISLLTKQTDQQLSKEMEMLIARLNKT